MNIKTDKSFKYNYEKLQPSTEEFKFLKETFMTTAFRLSFDINADRLKIYKVNERNPVKTEVKPVKNLMLFHGTSQKGAIGILKEGFRNSEKGWFGKGLYMTDCSYTAFNYADMTGPGGHLTSHCIFVNEVLESESMQILEYDLEMKMGEENVTHVNTVPDHTFEKHTLKTSLRTTEKDHMVDFEGRRYVKTRVENINDEYVADASVVIPRYLIVLEE